MKWASWVNVFLGIWLIAAPFILGYSQETTAVSNDIVIGAIVAILAFMRAVAKEHDPTRLNWISWINVIFGLWLIIGPFILGYSVITTAVSNDLIIGVLVVVFAGIRATGRKALRPTR
jgi:predicted membrane-bound dolichyl-phosphate-mannose-protein mannosyltransferase